MDYTDALTKYTGNFVDELANSGLHHIIISPGSRSTPLAMLFAEHDKIKDWVIVDERSAAFFALGMAKETMKPTALLCTSGTAAANYYPAIVEAYYSRTPLIVLTADRPHELRDTGASQTINQIDMYGSYVKWFHDMALPEGTDVMLNYVRRKASRAMYEAETGNKGPVHLNFPFREPLIPDLNLKDKWGKERLTSAYHSVHAGKNRLDQTAIDMLIERIESKQKGVIVCGPQVDPEVATSIVELATAWNLPVLADPLSQLRAGNHQKGSIIEGYDAILRQPSLRKQLRPDFVLRFGAMPISKSYLFYMKELENSAQFVVEAYAGTREPTGNATTFIYSEPSAFCNDLRFAMDEDKFANTEWLDKWKALNAVVKDHLNNSTNNILTEGEAIQCLFDVIPDNSTLFVGNSMAIRDVDTFFMATDKNIFMLANRGASGIDGIVSSGLGTAAATTKKVTLIIGDLSFYHDLNGLLTAKHYQLNITILLLNNNGGGIFSFLPQAKYEKHFEKLFGTPLHIDFKETVHMYGGQYVIATTRKELKEALLSSYEQPGISVLEVQTDRQANVKWHRDKLQQITKELLKDE